MEEIISYIMNTPENTNGNILREKLKNLDSDKFNYDYTLECTLTLDEDRDVEHLMGATGQMDKTGEDIQQLYETGYIKLNVVNKSGKKIVSYPVKPSFSSCGPALYTMLCSYEPFDLEFDFGAYLSYNTPFPSSAQMNGAFYAFRVNGSYSGEPNYITQVFAFDVNGTLEMSEHEELTPLPK